MWNRRSLLGAGLWGAGGVLLGLGMGERRTSAAVLSAQYHGDTILGQGEPEKRWYRQKFIGQPSMA